jgi:hypothetical protein
MRDITADILRERSFQVGLSFQDYRTSRVYGFLAILYAFGIDVSNCNVTFFEIRMQIHGK